MQYRDQLQEAVKLAHKGEELDGNALAWPEGLDRSVLRGLPLPNSTRNRLLRSESMAGDDRRTVAEMLQTPQVGLTTVRDMLIGVDEFLREYIDTFETGPGPADIAAMRLLKEVRRLTPWEAQIVDQRMLKHPPTRFHPLAVHLDMPAGQIASRLAEAKRRFEIALEPELQHIAAELEADLGPSPCASEVCCERIGEVLDSALPDDGDAVKRRTREVFRHALVAHQDTRKPADQVPTPVSDGAKTSAP